MSFYRSTFKIFCCVMLLLTATQSRAQLVVTPHDTTVCGSQLTLTAQLDTAPVTQITGLGDDSYSGVINLGFTFQYYGNNYTQVVIGSNGVVNFNTTYANSYCTWPINQAIPGGPADIRNSILVPWMDIYPGLGGVVNYTTVGVPGNRKFIVTWCNVPYFSCTNTRLITQCVLYESSNIIEIHLGTRASGCNWNSDYAIEGVQDATATNATPVPGRNYPTVWGAYHSSHRFVYSGGNYIVSPIIYAPVPVSNSLITWYNGPLNNINTSVVGTGNSITVNPTVPTTYYAMVVSCADTIFDTCHVEIGTGDSIDWFTWADPSLCGFSDGSAVLHGLTPGDTFIVNVDTNGSPMAPFPVIIPLDSSVTVNNLPNGNITIYAVNNGCATPPVTFTLTDPPFIIDSVTAINPTICGANDGYIKVWGVDVPGDSYIINYDKDGVAQPPAIILADAQSNVTVGGLSPGTYSNITVSNVYGCQATGYGPFTFVEPPFSVSFDTTINWGCAGDTINFTSTSVGVTMYSWTFGDGNTSSVANPQNIYLAQGVYYPTLVGSNGFCTGTASVELPLVHPLDAEFTISKDSICNGETVLFTNNSVGTPGYTYVWDFGDGSTDTAFHTSHQYTTDGIFPAKLKIVDYVPCISEEVKDIVVASVNINIWPKDTSVCLSDSMMLHSTTQAPPYFSGGIEYMWSPADHIGDPNVAETNFFSEDTGTYTYVLTATGYPMMCVDKDTLSFFVQPKPVLRNVTADQLITLGGSVQLQAEGALYYIWTPPATLDNPNISSPVATPTETTIYTVYGMNEHGGCRDTATVEISVDQSTDEFIPSVFSPNGDGRNDVFRVRGVTFQKVIEFRIFNRWGREVFSATDAASGWDGTYKGEPQDQGNYSYLIRVTRPDGQAQVYKGTIMLVR